MPTQLKKLRGNPGKRALPTREPIMPPAEPTEPPGELSDRVARQEWLRLEPLLRQSKTLTAADHASLVALCQQWARYLEANERVTSAGMVISTPSGYPVPNPYISIASKALALCIKLWSELGLTPSARSRVTKTGEDAPVDPLEAALAAPHATTH